MSTNDPIRVTPHDPETTAEFVQKSRVKLVTNAKGAVQPEITVVAGESEDEIQRILDIALRARNAALRSLGAAIAGR